MGADRWTTEEFLTGATTWVTSVAERAGVVLTGERDQPHARAWSSAVRFGTDEGPWWFKVNGPGTRHEGMLVDRVGRVVPDLVPDVLAVDPGRGWYLMRDAGPVLRVAAPPERLWGRWATVLATYAEAQVRLADHTDALLATGLDDLGPLRLPDRLAGMVEDLASLPEERGGLSKQDAARLRAHLPTYAGWCEELAGSGVPVSLDHSDLHSANVCLGPSGVTVIDWGDASLAHPFTTLLSTLGSVAHHAGTDLDDPRVVGVRDAYLARFSDRGSASDRARWVWLARRTGCLGRALSYVRALEGEPESAMAALDWPVRDWLLRSLGEG